MAAYEESLTKELALGDYPNQGVATCPCCSDVHYGPTVLCTECRRAGCDETRDASGDLGYWQCQLPDEADEADWRPARYASSEVKVTFYNGAGYVVRHDEYPHTTFTDHGPVIMQGHAMLVGARQGCHYRFKTGRAALGLRVGGLAIKRWTLPDTRP